MRSLGRGLAQAVVAHYCPRYLPLSEIFIYHYLKHGHLVRNTVLTDQSVSTASLFPFPRVRVISDFYVRWSRPWLLALADRRLWKRDPVESLLRREGVALIHAHFGHSGWKALPWARRLEIPLVTSFYGFDASRQPFLDLWSERLRELFEHGQQFLVEGSCMRNQLIALGCPADKISLQRIAVDVSLIPYRERYCGQGEPVRLLFCGRFVEKKGLEYALRAVAELKKTGLSFEMRVIGDGPLRSSLEELVNVLDVGEAVELLGFVPYSSMVGELLDAHILIAPSVTAEDGDSEGGAPTVLLDAQASGLPIVASCHADIPEVVLDGETGYLVPERDEAALSETLAFLVTHRELWPRLGRSGRRHIEDHHDVRVLVPQLEEKYLSLLGRDPALR